MRTSKFWRIIASRFKKEKQQPWTEDRRKICRDCPFNTLNMEKANFRIKIIKALSDFYTWITLNEKEDRGTCSECGCPISLKTAEDPEYETCPKGYWK